MTNQLTWSWSASSQMRKSTSSWMPVVFMAPAAVAPTSYPPRGPRLWKVPSCPSSPGGQDDEDEGEEDEGGGEEEEVDGDDNDDEDEEEEEEEA